MKGETAPLTWQWTRFAGLSVDDLYDALALRSLIFVVEQDCVYMDADGIDRHAWHLLGRDSRGELLAYCRLVDIGHKYDVPSMGRVVVHPSQRGTGLGHGLVAEALRRADATWPGARNYISAQAHLQAFYGSHGYVPMGETYLEDDIPHIAMERAAP
jgi:ElaA protein